MPEPDLKPRLAHLPRARQGEDLQFTIEHWLVDREALVNLHEVLARAGNLIIARAAYAEAVRQRPAARILLRQASRVVLDSGRDGAPSGG